MSKDSKLKQFAQRIASVFSSKEPPQKSEKNTPQRYMRLNFFLLNHALDHIQKGNSIKSQSLFTKKILASDNKHLSEIVKQAESCCSRQDLHLMSYKQFFLRNEFAMKQVIEWKLSRYIKEEEKIRTFIEKVKGASPEAFKRHLITLLNQEKTDFSQEDLEKELKRQEENWRLYQTHGDTGPNTVSRI